MASPILRRQELESRCSTPGTRLVQFRALFNRLELPNVKYEILPHTLVGLRVPIGRLPPSESDFVFKAHRLCVSLNSRLESNKEEEDFGAFRGTDAAEISRRN